MATLEGSIQFKKGAERNSIRDVVLHILTFIKETAVDMSWLSKGLIRAQNYG